MLVQAHSFSYPSGVLPRTLDSATTQFRAIRNDWRLGKFGRFSSVAGKWNYRDLRLNGIMNVGFRQKQNRSVMFSVSEGQSSTAETARKRKVVEHVCLLKAKEDLSDEKENEMMDYLYTSQYQMGGIVAVSLGRISDQNLENYTHAFYMRFQRKEDLAKFYNNPFYLGVLKDYVMPYCHEFNYGVEFILLFEFFESALGKPGEDALAYLARLTTKFPSLIVQATQGSNFNLTSKEYTHGTVIRFRSFEAFELFTGSSEYEDMWISKFQPIARKILSIHFAVDPVGTEIM